MAGFSLKLIPGFILLGAVLGAPLDEIHNHMTPEEKHEIFHTKGTFVPPYKVVQVHSSKVQKRDVNAGHIIEMKINGQHIKSWLTPLDGVLANENTPLRAVQSTPNGIKFSRDPYTMKQVISQIYENKAHAITVAVEESPDGGRKMNGVIGNQNSFIRPIPDRLFREILKRLGRSIGDEFESDHEDKTYHIVYDMPLAHDNTTIMSPLTQSQRLKRSAGYDNIVYPEILVIVDYSLIEKLGIDVHKILQYILAFWNGVDIKYRNLDHPKYRLNIAGILIAADENALAYIRKISPQNIDVDQTLEQSGSWLYQVQDTQLDPFDAAVTMTAFDLYSKGKSTEYHGGILGLAWVGGTCSVDHDRQTMTKTAVVHDEGGYGGIQTAAHELGHLLGASHDGSDHGECPHNDGFIMSGSAVRDSTKSSDWSPCSRRDFAEFLNKNPTCILNKPKGADGPRLLPGKLMDANEQCMMIEKTKAAKIDASICLQLKCWQLGSTSWYNILGSSAAEGTPCGDGLICIHGKCVDEKVIM